MISRHFTTTAYGDYTQQFYTIGDAENDIGGFLNDEFAGNFKHLRMSLRDIAGPVNGFSYTMHGAFRKTSVWALQCRRHKLCASGSTELAQS